MRLNTRARRDAYAQAVAAYDRAEAGGDTVLADAIYNGPLKEASARLPWRVRARIDDAWPVVGGV